MGMFIAVRGWLELDFGQRQAAEQIIEEHEEGLYSGGWAFPREPFNWTLFLFYGGNLRELSVPWLRDQVALLAALPPVDEDEDRPRGFFLLSDELGNAWSWHVRDGAVHDTPADQLAWLDD